MQNNTYKITRGTSEMFDEYMRFINSVFGFDGVTQDFSRLLPKLYQPKYAPAVSSYVVREDGMLRGVIGAFDHDLSVCGTILKTRGIGNVAVHPDSRGKGYMKSMMDTALDDMVKDGVVLSVLGGRRQRYRYFSYDRTGSVLSFTVNADNMRHTFGSARKHEISFVPVTRDSADALEKIQALSRSMPFYPLRDGADFYDILVSWEQKVLAGYRNGRFVGYAVMAGNEAMELLVTEDTMLLPFVAALYDHRGEGTLYVKLPLYLQSYIDALYQFCESYTIGIGQCYSVLNYRVVIEAFLKLKATYTSLPDGALVLDIDGRGGRERLKIEVKHGQIAVLDTADLPNETLSHLDAMNLLFSSVCPMRERLPAFARLWFPLPIFIYRSDVV